MKQFALILLSLFSVMLLSAQTQQGYVKTIGRPGKPGVPLQNVTIQMAGMVNAVNSSSTGVFYLLTHNKKDGDVIRLIRVQKNGYELKEKDLIGRPLAFSSQVPIYITMVDVKQLIADKKRIEDNARRVAEKNYQTKLAALQQQNKERKLSAEKYRQELENLQGSYEKYLSLIGNMADRYARTDYDQLDSIDAEINICIENGELEKADSLIHTVFDPETVLERNRAAKEEIRQRIEFAQSVIDKAMADKNAILQDFDYALRIAELSERLANEYIISKKKEKAIQCLKASLDLKTIILGRENEYIKYLNHKIKELKQ